MNTNETIASVPVVEVVTTTANNSHFANLPFKLKTWQDDSIQAYIEDFNNLKRTTGATLLKMAHLIYQVESQKPEHEKVLFANADRARALVKRVVPKLGPERTDSPLGIEKTLDTALITAPEKRDSDLFRKLDAVAGRVLKKTS